MRLLTSFEIPHDYGLVIGNFDGVHKGHRSFLKAFNQRCKQRGLYSVVLTFRDHPSFFFEPKLENFVLCSRSRKHSLIDQCDIDYLIELDFDEKLQSLSAKDFLKKFVFDNAQIKYFAMGHDFALGRGKEDAVQVAKEFAQSKGVDISEEDSYTDNGDIVSSTLIRKMLQVGNVERASSLLERHYCLESKVVKGQGIGNRELVPTINFSIQSQNLVPKSGVYFTWVKIKHRYFYGVTNIGVRPSVNSSNQNVVETHILNFDQDVYGESAELYFVKRIRDEIKFNSLATLKLQIQKDIDICKKLIEQEPKLHLALLGKNIGHSRSQLMYEKFLNKSIMYDLCDFESDQDIPNLDFFLKQYNGLSITAPYKDHFKSVVTIKGDYQNSVNTISIKKEATNTDFLAARDIFDKLEVNGSDVFLLGDGAMAKMMLHIFDENKISFHQFSRKLKNLDHLDKKIEESKKPVFVINTLAREYVLKLSPIKPVRLWDFNYSTEYSNQLREHKNIEYFDGKELLELQAKYALSFWNLKSL